MEQRFTEIKSQPRSRVMLPRLGKIRLGIKAISKGGKEYPKEVSHFVCPPEFEDKYETEPNELDIMFPVEQEHIFFPYMYKAYSGAGKVVCRGNGEVGERTDKETGEKSDIACPCDWLDSKKCAKKAHLMVFCPDISMGGIYQIDTGSGRNITTINSYILYMKSLFGRCSMIPIKMSRRPEKIEHEGKMTTHYMLHFQYQGNIAEANKLRSDSKLIIDRTNQFEIEAPHDEEEIPMPVVLVDEEDETDITPFPEEPMEVVTPPEKKPEQKKATAKKRPAKSQLPVKNEVNIPKYCESCELKHQCVEVIGKTQQQLLDCTYLEQ